MTSEANHRSKTARTFRVLLPSLVGVLIALGAPAAAFGHHGNGDARCEGGTVNLVGFNSRDKSRGIDIVAKIDENTPGERTLATKHVDGFSGSNATIRLTWTKPADAASHRIHIYIRWRTGDDDFTRTVSNCCPTPPPPPPPTVGPCCVDGQPGADGPAGADGKPGADGQPGTGTNTIVRETIVVERVVEKTCTSNRVYKFLVKRWHIPEVPEGTVVKAYRVKTGPAKRNLKATGADDDRITWKRIKYKKHWRWQVTVRPPVGGRHAVPGQMHATNVTIRLHGKKGRFETVERFRVCMKKNGNLNHPSASGPARGN